MAGLNLRGNVDVGGNVAGGTPIMTRTPAAATTATSVGDLAFGPNSTPVTTSGQSMSDLLAPSGGALAFWVGVACVAGLVLVYKSLPR